MTIGEVCSTISDTYRAKADKVTLINTSDVLEGKVLNHTRVPNKELKGQFKKTFKKNDILYSEIRPQNKRFAFVDFDPVDYIASTKLMVLRADVSKVLPTYLYFYLKSAPVIAELQMLAETRSGTFPQITFTELSTLSIPVPNITEQEVIVSTIKCIEDKIDCNADINDNLLQQAKTIFREWFIGNPEKDIWPLVTLDSLTSLISRGITPKYADDSTQVVLNQKCIRDHYIDTALARKHNPKVINEKWLQYGDLLINSTGEGTLGRAAQVWFVPENMTVDSHVTVVRPQNQQLIFYIGLWGLSHEREFEALHTGSTGQTELPRDRVRDLELRMPDNDILTRFNSVIEPMVSAIIVNQQENSRLANIRDTLLPRLTSGEIDVSDIQL